MKNPQNEKKLNELFKLAHSLLDEDMRHDAFDVWKIIVQKLNTWSDGHLLAKKYNTEIVELRDRFLEGKENPVSANKKQIKWAKGDGGSEGIAIKDPTTRTIVLKVKKVFQHENGIKSEKELTPEDMKEIYNRAMKIKRKVEKANGKEKTEVIDLTPYFTEDELNRKNPHRGWPKKLANFLNEMDYRLDRYVDEIDGIEVSTWIISVPSDPSVGLFGGEIMTVYAPVGTDDVTFTEETDLHKEAKGLSEVVSDFSEKDAYEWLMDMKRTFIHEFLRAHKLPPTTIVKEKLMKKKNPPSFVRTKKDEKLWRKAKRIVKEEYASGKPYSKFTPRNWRQVAGIYWNIKDGLPVESNPRYDSRALKRGTAVEMEHTSDPEVAAQIAVDHLLEDPEYYEKLETMHNPEPKSLIVASIERRIKILKELLSQPLSPADEEYFKGELAKLEDQLVKKSNPVLPELEIEEVE